MLTDLFDQRHTNPLQVLFALGPCLLLENAVAHLAAISHGRHRLSRFFRVAIFVNFHYERIALLHGILSYAQTQCIGRGATHKAVYSSRPRAIRSRDVVSSGYFTSQMVVVLLTSLDTMSKALPVGL